jgi:hypothetical protein
MLLGIDGRRIRAWRPSRRQVAALQAAYFLPTGAAPFVSRRVFEAVTGPKLEWWLVLTVGTQVSATGAALARAAQRDRVTDELRLLGIGAAAGLGAIDIVHAARGRISPVYLLDAVLELALLSAWLRCGPPPEDRGDGTLS